ncbi:hypothetical protein [Glutamicibacter nicotianae]
MPPVFLDVARSGVVGGQGELDFFFLVAGQIRDLSGEMFHVAALVIEASEGIEWVFTVAPFLPSRA